MATQNSEAAWTKHYDAQNYTSAEAWGRDIASSNFSNMLAGPAEYVGDDSDAWENVVGTAMGIDGGVRGPVYEAADKEWSQLVKAHNVPAIPTADTM